MSLNSSDRKPFSIKQPNDDENKRDNESTASSSLSTLSRFKDYLSGTRRSKRSDDIELLKPLDLSDEYERINTVGLGSFGIAVLYKRLKDGVLVVLKQINLIDLNRAEKDMAMNEVDIFSKLHHPNIITYYSSFIKGNFLLIEMEYADGGTLASYIMENTEYLPERFILNVFEQITSAINYMHSENILHRDLKCANVFLTSNGLVKIGDFGISKIMNTKINTKTILGTPYYFS
jgi:NIMA (never in mitosis gene a)-related kinase